MRRGDVKMTTSTYVMGSGTGCLLQSLDSAKLKIKSDALNLLYYKYSGSEQDGFIVECVILGEYGCGKTLGEALADLKSSIVDYYFMLKRHQKALEKEWEPAPIGSMSHDWQMLRAYLEENTPETKHSVK